MANKPQTQPTRCEVADLYFWLGAEAEIVGFTPWISGWIAATRRAEAVGCGLANEALIDNRDWLHHFYREVRP